MSWWHGRLARADLALRAHGRDARATDYHLVVSTSRQSRPTDPEAPHELRQVERLRPYRQVHDRAKPLADDFAKLARSHGRTGTRLEGLSEVWDACCPPGLIERAALRSISRGVLTIAVSDATTRYAVERAVKGGLDLELIRAAPMTVRKVKVVLAREDQDEDRR